MSAKTISVNQPYFFPYIGFFQLIYASDKFVSLEDVNYITGGWINRNRILINNEPAYLSVKIADASQNRKINETEILNTEDWKEDLLKKLRISYSRAPFYTNTFTVVRKVLSTESNLISDISLQSIIEVCRYIGLEREFGKSSPDIPGKGEEKIIGLCRSESATSYINLPGGEGIYSKEKFRENSIGLRFLQPVIEEYVQFRKPFVPSLSILDVMMFNPPEKILEMASKYGLK